MFIIAERFMPKQFFIKELSRKSSWDVPYVKNILALFFSREVRL
jgi:hypothetical protein